MVTHKTIHELMVVAVDEEDFQTGVIGAIQTFSDSLRSNPHVYGLAPRGGWSSSGEWFPVQQVFYQERTGHDRHGSQLLDPMEFIARVLIHIPEPGRHSVHYWGSTRAVDVSDLS